MKPTTPVKSAPQCIKALLAAKVTSNPLFASIQTRADMAAKAIICRMAEVTKGRESF